MCCPQYAPSWTCMDTGGAAHTCQPGLQHLHLLRWLLWGDPPIPHLLFFITAPNQDRPHKRARNTPIRSPVHRTWWQQSLQTQRSSRRTCRFTTENCDVTGNESMFIWHHKHSEDRICRSLQRKHLLDRLLLRLSLWDAVADVALFEKSPAFLPPSDANR